MPGIVIRMCIAFAIAAASCGVASEARLVATAATLLLDNQPLCEDLARARGVGSSRVRAVRLALGRETLSIASEIVARVDSRRSAGRDLATALRLQRRLCGTALARGEAAALLMEMEAVLARLEGLAPRRSEARQRLLDPFLARREGAVLAVVVSAPRREAESGARSDFGRTVPVSELMNGRPDRSAVAVSGGGPGIPDGSVASGVAIAGVGQEPGEADGSPVALLAPRAGETPERLVGARGNDDEESRIADGQTWDPPPAELERRRRARQESFDLLMAGWRPRMSRELRPLIEVRSRLATQLETHSLEQVRDLCSRLGQEAKRVEYSLVLESPVRAARADLDRMLAAYVTAGRWCDEGRFSFAWMEISAADERWGRVRSLLGLLDR